MRMLVTELDRSGYLELDGLSPTEAVALHTEMPIELVNVGLTRLLKREVFVVVGDRLFMPNYVEAQTTSKSEAQRKREQRDREAADKAEWSALASVTKRDATVTEGDDVESRIVNNSHDQSEPVPPPSRNVTLSLTLIPDLVPDPDLDLDPEHIPPPSGGESATAKPSRDVFSRQVFEHWASAMGKPSTVKLTPQRRAKVKARLRDGYTAEQLCQAVDGCKRSAFHMGENERGQPYNDLETILRSGKTVEEHIARLQTPTNGLRLRGAGEVSAEFDPTGNPSWAQVKNG